MANVKETAAAVKSAAAKKVEETKVAAKEAVKVAETVVKETEEKVAKVVEAKVAEVAADEKTAKVAEKTKETAVKAKEAVKKTAAKTVAKKPNGAEPEMFIQFGGNDAPIATIIEKVRASFVEQGHRASSIKDLKVYLKPEDNAAYYVINKNFAGKVNLF